MNGVERGSRNIFHLILIKPSHYDDDGYVIQWLRSLIPSNSLAVLHSLAADCRERRVLGDDVDIRLSAYDETNTRIRVNDIVARIRRDGGRGLVGMIGVQTNQFPRAMDLARQFRAAGLPVCIGGFHVSGVMAMLPDLTPELQEALDCGVSLFAGEAEGRLDQVLQDAWRGALQPIYNFMHDLPGLQAMPTPLLPEARVARTMGRWTSFDGGRGCPFQCSFCCIINVQGRKSRFRSADDVERIVRENLAQRIARFFITDDNFARNRNWEEIFDRLIRLREVEGLNIKFVIQVDTLCHKTPNFIEKAVRAGVRQVFIGLESINPENLVGAKKRQNKITEYRTMLQAWQKAGVLTYAGYILGFPGDTPESIERDIRIVQRELPVDLLEFFKLGPIPGSEDHKGLYLQKAWMEPDLNKYDGHHICMEHPAMSAAAWERAYRQAWEQFYAPEFVETRLRRARTAGLRLYKVAGVNAVFYACIAVENVHPLEGGFVRRKVRTDRRPGLPVESPLVFYPRYAWETVSKHARLFRIWWRFDRIRRAIEADPASRAYTDLALTPVDASELDELEIFTTSEAAHAAVARTRSLQATAKVAATAH